MLAFVPFVPSRPPSPRAEELGQRLAETIEQFRVQHPDLDRADVLQAMTLAASRSGGEPAVPRGAAIAMLMGVVLLGLFVALGIGGGRCPASTPMLAVALAIAAVVVVLLLKRR